jgi:hypothetical protein
VVAVIAVGVALAGGSKSSSQTSKPRHAATTRSRASNTAHRPRSIAARRTPRTTARPGQDQPTPSDPDNVQSGDQTTPDQPAASSESESNSESESSSDNSEQGQPGEPAVGHQDPPGQNVDHQCDGNCQE